MESSPSPDSSFVEYLTTEPCITAQSKKKSLRLTLSLPTGSDIHLIQNMVAESLKQNNKKKISHLANQILHSGLRFQLSKTCDVIHFNETRADGLCGYYLIAQILEQNRTQNKKLPPPSLNVYNRAERLILQQHLNEVTVACESPLIKSKFRAVLKILKETIFNKENKDFSVSASTNLWFDMEWLKEIWKGPLLPDMNVSFFLRDEHLPIPESGHFWATLHCNSMELDKERYFTYKSLLNFLQNDPTFVNLNLKHFYFNDINVRNPKQVLYQMLQDISKELIVHYTKLLTRPSPIILNNLPSLLPSLSIYNSQDNSEENDNTVKAPLSSINSQYSPTNLFTEFELNVLTNTHFSSPLSTSIINTGDSNSLSLTEVTTAANLLLSLNTSIQTQSPGDNIHLSQQSSCLDNLHINLIQH